MGDIVYSMAVPAKLEQKQREGLELLDAETQATARHAAKLYGLGHDRKEIAKVLAEKLYGHREMRREDKEKSARSRLRAWEQKQWFRDLVWDAAVVELDMAGPQILRGISRKAKRGRVDAAKLALSITGRHREKDDNRPSAIQINIGSMPRPAHQAVEAPADITLDGSEVRED